MHGCIDTREGRELFGCDPQNYDAIRPQYPEEIFNLLVNSGALRIGTSTLEIGAGSGIATRRLLEHGADPLTVVEPDARFAPLLRETGNRFGAEFQLRIEPFEESDLPRCHYDLVVAATSFHWLDPAIGMTKAAEVLKPDGYAAFWWHLFGDPERHDAFHEATRTILEPLSDSPSGVVGGVPYALDVGSRLLDFAATGMFDEPQFQVSRWTLTLTTDQVRSLYATFSTINRVEPARRTRILDQLMEVADREFGGVVERNMVSPIYLARRNTRLEGPPCD